MKTSTLLLIALGLFVWSRSSATRGLGMASVSAQFGPRNGIRLPPGFGARYPLSNPYMPPR